VSLCTKNIQNKSSRSVILEAACLSWPAKLSSSSQYNKPGQVCLNQLQSVLQTAEISGGAKYFECKRATVFGLGHRVSKHKTTYATIFLGGMAPLATGATPVVANTKDLQNYCLSTYIDLSKSLCGMLCFPSSAKRLICGVANVIIANFRKACTQFDYCRH